MIAPDSFIVPAQPPTPKASTMTMASPATMWRRIDRRDSVVCAGRRRVDLLAGPGEKIEPARADLCSGAHDFAVASVGHDLERARRDRFTLRRRVPGPRLWDRKPERAPGS